ncbi:MAG TPA: hypothetical protein VG777_00155 [Thermoanaerobaculia bacterium]|nr:hypothetical protein [Thermoanaerobaculia bacterium]
MKALAAAAAAAFALRLGAAEPAPAFGNAPYDAAAPSPARISVRIDLSAADEILAALSPDKPRPGDASTLQANSAVRRQISESGKPDTVWNEDLAAAFQPESRPGTFDFRSIRLDRERWKVCLEGVKGDAAEIARSAARRADALLPPDFPAGFSAEVDLTFALAGIEDHVLFPEGNRRAVVLIDLGRAITENPGNPRAETAETISRLAAAETFRAAWASYLKSSPAWQKPGAGPVDPLLRAVATVAPVALFAFDRNFFPLSRWLHEDLIRAIDAFNQEAAVLADPKTDIGKRAEILAGLRKPGLRPDAALSAGAFLADGVYQSSGRPALVDALANGPEGLFEAYAAAAAKKKSGLPPLTPKLRAARGKK